MSLIDESEKQKRIIVCINNAIESNLGKNVAKTLYVRFQTETGLNPPDALYENPERFTEFLKTMIPSAAPLIENQIITAIKSTFILPKERVIRSLSEAISIAEIPVVVKGDVTLDEVEARIVKCVQYALRNTFSEPTVQVIFQKYEETTNLGLRTVATRPDGFLTFLKSMLGPPVRNIEHVFLREIISEFGDDIDLRPSNFVDTVNRLRMHYMEREMDWGSG